MVAFCPESTIAVDGKRSKRRGEELLSHGWCHIDGCQTAHQWWREVCQAVSRILGCTAWTEYCTIQRVPKHCNNKNCVTAFTWGNTTMYRTNGGRDGAIREKCRGNMLNHQRITYTRQQFLKYFRWHIPVRLVQFCHAFDIREQKSLILDWTCRVVCMILLLPCSLLLLLKKWW